MVRRFGITLSTGQQVVIESSQDDPFTALEDCDFFTVHEQRFVVVEQVSFADVYQPKRAILNMAHIVAVEPVG